MEFGYIVTQNVVKDDQCLSVAEIAGTLKNYEIKTSSCMSKCYLNLLLVNVAVGVV